ncbi:MAG TPA: LD-carboxypeptidase [Rhizomicrobium sp.]|nr:LD-carboxypeptidase [Rhizomicrobium sp.]
MSEKTVKIAIVAPASRLEPETADRVSTLAAALYGDRVSLVFHPQCFLSDGHFAGDDAARAAAFLEAANDTAYDAVWVARGGYGSNRIAERVVAGLTGAARKKLYLGYSDAGFILGALYKAGCGVAHGPVVADIKRAGGEAAVTRALRYIMDRDARALEPSVCADAPSAAFNLTVLSHMIGTPLMPDLSGHVLMVEDVSEHMYRIDRAFFHVTSNPGIRKVAGIRLGRTSDIPVNEPEFGRNEEDVAKHWCDASGIAYLGAADIGHDVENRVVPFGRLQAASA